MSSTHEFGTVLTHAIGALSSSIRIKSPHYGSGKLIETVTADRTLTAYDAGKVFLVGTAGVDFTLPARSTFASDDAAEFEFRISAAFASTACTITCNAADHFEGNVMATEIDNASDSPSSTANTIMTISASAETIGDRYVISAGKAATWNVYGVTTLRAGVAFSGP